MISTSFIIVGGLKKCIWTTLSGRLVASAIELIGSEVVFVARMTSGRASLSNSTKTFLFISMSSSTLSITKSHSLGGA